ncbi:hypothetical protein BABINDRAFT_168352 [Babjeviella inositovora NRRL Y-12698]|uniref:Uncharacterized protein n=1 Tax=Babjeviella inositovora NRRL Y-12698 TaxID=984486 RepID=A0A1E3QKL3_9ASCO|nr:uncharacterized protein BABINDRAFT_168352 [Babjeviella inositovora NRRL Y-12698]ODQ78158.1 hypothetical protein BABINDRAFT_168352 [Babjeviella inositovora NRRL Y-12698]
MAAPHINDGKSSDKPLLRGSSRELSVQPKSLKDNNRYETSVSQSPISPLSLLLRAVIPLIMFILAYWILTSSTDPYTSLFVGTLARQYFYGERLALSASGAHATTLTGPIFLNFDFDPNSPFPVEMGESAMVLVVVVVIFTVLMM